MGPSGRTRTRTRTARKSSSSKRKSQLIKKSVVERQEKEETTTSFIQSSPSLSSSSNDELPKTEGIEFEAVDDVVSTSGCSTPKGQRYRIPDVVTCPPAPKKQRVISNNFSIQRTPIAFFAPPDLELFFCLAVRGISV
ncbi:cyclin-dependent protein kinase inhibitor SMR13-like [Humulus lupulus]|uniref:cyclin-dependent protein kinase inhibitor SMR13-like n=1 Tax=Humulus lupulus TaxID=3486 RepID=UPI002B40AE23|nr:cyclin-dependent protein kinase inhibitor SMR13-like [Humulus lupulus]